MKKNLIVICAVSTLVSVALAQHPSSSNNASLNSNSSVSASGSGVNAQSNANVNASSQTDVSASKHQDSKRAKESRHSEQAKDQKNGSADANGSLAAGSTISAVLSKPVDSRKCKPGDEIFATASQDVKADGKVVIRKGSRLVGHVTEAKAKGQGEANSSLGIMFDHAILKNGQQVQMNSMVQAIAENKVGTASSMGDSMDAMGGGSIASTGSARGGGGGLLRGVSSTASSTTGAAGNLGANAAGALNTGTGSTANLGNGLNGALNSSSTGVVGMKGLSLASGATNSTQGSLITSSGKSVHLDSGTQMVLRVVGKQ